MGTWPVLGRKFSDNHTFLLPIHLILIHYTFLKIYFWQVSKSRRASCLNAHFLLNLNSFSKFLPSHIWLVSWHHYIYTFNVTCHEMQIINSPIICLATLFYPEVEWNCQLFYTSRSRWHTCLPNNLWALERYNIRSQTLQLARNYWWIARIR